MKQQTTKKCLFCEKNAMSLAQTSSSKETNYYLFCADCAKIWKRKLNKVFGTEDGQDILFVVAYLSKVLEPTYTGTAETHFNEGVRFLGTWLLKQVLKADEDNGLAVLKKLIN